MGCVRKRSHRPGAILSAVLCELRRRPRVSEGYTVEHIRFYTAPHTHTNAVPSCVARVGAHTKDTYIFVTFPFLQVAVGETSSALTVGDELAEKIHGTPLPLC